VGGRKHEEVDRGMKIYLAGPYSHPDPGIRRQRFEALNHAAALVMREGHIVFSPISHSHPIAVQCDLPKGFEFWQKQDLSFIDWCDEVWVVPISGYRESKGLRAEIEYAKRIGKPVEVYIW
jgi:nucleoside 2-deoxyribosyltransferase